ncbi:hypothetical protein BJN34_05795 [Cupriavidus necator]|uniref:Uncharacterized protein n=1 Tax=Cupriavidus necator TaxID=106590 RepID=A0A1U9UMK4_CUPNE|nr:hypothetical protein [Cupriavidus necator]AQV93405.1 hypothetical protein BJN34_05795 [Cupriavidus necator]
MSAADRFIAGEDRLSALLRALPAYAPSDALAASVHAAARAAQQEADLRRASAAGLPFPAPPTLAAAVLEEASRLQAAQAARRDAVLARVGSGEAAENILGAPVSPAASEWLQAQATASAQETARKAAQQAAQSRLTRAARARRWWRSLGLVASVAAVAGLTTSIVLRQIDDGALLPVTTSEMSASPPAPSTEPSPAPSPETAAAAPANPPPPAAKAVPPARREARRAPASEDKPRSSMPAERSAPREFIMDSQAPAQASLAPSPAAPAIAAAQSAPADAVMAEAAPAPPPLPAPAAQAGFARKAAPPAMAARAPAAVAASAVHAMTVSTQDDPAIMATRLGTGTPLRLWAAEPDNAEIREWAERLWQSMPAGQRPPVPYAVQADRTLAPGQMRIELRREVPQDAPR